MPQSYVKIWVHAVFSTKYRQHIIEEKVAPQIYQYMKEELNAMNCYTQIINGMPDHVHILFLLNPQKSLSEVMKNLKGGSSHTINQENLTREKFAWQNSYGAFSVSDNRMHIVEKYIKNQQQHHAVKSFQDEWDDFLTTHRFAVVENDD